ncbi:MAG: hypothetical protein WDA09_08985 [Bacteriovoracaceae bacterium]
MANQQSGEPSGQVKEEGLKSFSHEKQQQQNESKKGGHMKSGNNPSVSEDEWEENEKQQAGGTHKGGFVQGAHGNESPDGGEPLKRGM